LVVSDVPRQVVVSGDPSRVAKRIGELTCDTGITSEGEEYRPHGHIEDWG